MSDRAIVQEILKRLETRHTEMQTLRQQVKELREENSVERVTKKLLEEVHKENIELRRQNEELRQRVHGLMTNQPKSI